MPMWQNGRYQIQVLLKCCLCIASLKYKDRPQRYRLPLLGLFSRLKILNSIFSSLKPRFTSPFQIFSSLTQYALDIILIPSLQDVEDMVDMKNPEWMSVMTYISLIYNHFNGIRVGGPKLPPMPDQEQGVWVKWKY